MRSKFLAVLLLAIPVFASAQEARATCEQIANLAESQAAEVIPRLGFTVDGKERLYFHSAPFASCKTKVFIVPSDHVTAYQEFDGWFYVQYLHPTTGEVADGWVTAKRLRSTGTMGLTQ